MPTRSLFTPHLSRPLHLLKAFDCHAVFTPRQSGLSFSSRGNDIPDLIYPDPPTKLHRDLSSFLAYAEQTGLDKASTVYRGTLYEYMVGRSLARYGFDLRRVGGANDAGVDLLGTWRLPGRRGRRSEAEKGATESKAEGEGTEGSCSRTAATIRVLVQCKFESKKPGPRHVRELEGSFAGAPAGWTGTEGEPVMGFVVGKMAATKGLREALGRSGRAMGYVACGEGGGVQQMLWNGRAEEQGLQGLGVAMKRFEDGREGELVLTMHGRVVPLIKV